MKYATVIDTPLLAHPLEEPSAFAAKSLVDAVRAERGAPAVPIPKVCILDFDGDLTDWLAKTGGSRRNDAWACFHTVMDEIELDGLTAGIVARAIGGPYSVLIAEQMLVSGAEVIVGLTSAGRVSRALPLPSLVVPTQALRDEGTSLHYLPPSRFVDAPVDLAAALASELGEVGLPVVRGPVWTTDAPYRETATQLREHSREGLLAVEMQAASLFALAEARGADIGVVAHVTNAVDNSGEDFDKGDDELSDRILERIVRAGYRRLGLADNDPER